MHVVIVNHYAVPPGVGGGTRHADLARQWAAHGHTVSILASSFNHFAPTERLARQSTLTPGVTLVTRWTPGYAGNGLRRATDMVWFAASAVVCGRQTIGAPSVVIGSSPHPFAAVAALRVARRLGVPFVLEIRDLWPRTLVDLGGLSPDSVITRALYRQEAHLLRSATSVVYLPPAADRYFDELGIRPRRAVHIPNATAVEDVDLTLDDPLLALVEREQRAGRTVLTYTGALGRANDVATVVEAAHLARRDGVLLVICGDGPDRAELAAVVRDRGIDNVLLVGQVPKQVALAVQRASDANVFHLRPAAVFDFGLSPNKLVDYLLSGRPVLYAGPEVDNPAGRAGAAVIARPSDPASVAEAMRAIVTMPAAERAARGAQGRAYAQRVHTTAHTASDYLEVLRESVDAHRVAGGRS